MRDYIVKRVLLMIPAIVIVSILSFSLVHLVPGDVVMAMLAEAPNFKQEDVDALRHELGLDRPLHVQYFVWLFGEQREIAKPTETQAQPYQISGTGPLICPDRFQNPRANQPVVSCFYRGVIMGNLGKSLWSSTPVNDEIGRRLPVTLELAVLTLIVSTFVAIAFGIISATRQDTILDYLLRVVSIGGLSVPNFWVGTLLIVFPVIWFGYMAPLTYIPFDQDPAGNLRQFLVPSIALGLQLSAGIMRMTRSSMLEVLRQDYVRTAWAKGLREWVVILRHALKNAMIPVITMIGTQFAYLLSGTVILESIFGLPGIGRLMLESITQRDYILLQGNVLFIAAAFLIINLLVDLSYAVLDPRIRY
jgi:peptide/nickel transport system permease protein